MHIRNTAEKFRFSTLQARYGLLRFVGAQPQSEGRGTAATPYSRGAPAATPATPEAPAPPARAARADREKPQESGPRVVAVAAIRDPAKDGDRLKALSRAVVERAKAGR